MLVSIRLIQVARHHDLSIIVHVIPTAIIRQIRGADLEVKYHHQAPAQAISLVSCLIE